MNLAFADHGLDDQEIRRFVFKKILLIF